jgi:hypothetical protein
MEAPPDADTGAPQSDIYFVLERATLETGKVGKARCVRRAAC